MDNDNQPPLPLLSLSRATPPPTEHPTETHTHPHGHTASPLLYIPDGDDYVMKKPRCRRLWMAVVGLLFVAVTFGLGYLSGQLHSGQSTGAPRDVNQSEHSDQSPLAHRHVSKSEGERPAQEQNNTSWKDNARQVADLGCKPVLTKVCVRALADMQTDLEPYPSHLAVSRCVDENSFCRYPYGGEGTAAGRCDVKSGKNVTKSFQVCMNYNPSKKECEGEQETVYYEVHLECECVEPLMMASCTSHNSSSGDGR